MGGLKFENKAMPTDPCRLVVTRPRTKEKSRTFPTSRSAREPRTALPVPLPPQFLPLSTWRRKSLTHRRQRGTEAVGKPRRILSLRSRPETRPFLWGSIGQQHQSPERGCIDRRTAAFPRWRSALEAWCPDSMWRREETADCRNPRKRRERLRNRDRRILLWHGTCFMAHREKWSEGNEVIYIHWVIKAKRRGKKESSKEGSSRKCWNEKWWKIMRKNE